MKLNKIPIYISIALLLMPVIFNFHPEIGYYTFLRLVVCGTAMYLSYFANNINKKMWMWGSGLLALLFNPFLPIHLSMDTWRNIDIIASLFFLISIFILDRGIWASICRLTDNPKEVVVLKWVNRIGISSILFLILMFVLDLLGINSTPFQLLNNSLVFLLISSIFIVGFYLLFMCMLFFRAMIKVKRGIEK